ncbi:class I SAM-dependent methyltransferase [Uliginosibacterium sediminicola]|uniref:Class I SAM-dependent methyltransferase n=1 Tax=Uliginosibacterium sediminicola TaxID=2024550 RepID=A0ABU9YVA2_9RHOO
MTTESNPTQALLSWTENGQTHSAPWRSGNGSPPPARVVPGDDTMNADTAYRLACEGTAILWFGDFQNARQLLQALVRRTDRKSPAKQNSKKPALSITETFHKQRMAQAQRARILGMLLIPFEAGHGISLRRAPDVQEACAAALGEADTPYVASLRELLGFISAHEWRKKGVEIAALGARIHPHYGVFSPVRGEYIDLVVRADLPKVMEKQSLAFDIGTGTGVIAALLAHRGVKRIVATELDERALACARENIKRLGFAPRVDILQADLFPPGQAPLIVCNPPWLPGKPATPLEHAIYDQDSAMLRGFLQGLAAHLSPGGQGWLLLSDLAERLGLRSETMLAELIAAAGLKVLGRLDIRPRHPRSQDEQDPLHAARSQEVTTLWRLAPNKPAE